MKDKRLETVLVTIRNKREQLGYSQLYIATKLSLSQNGYSKLELGYYDMTVDRLLELCELLDICPDEIFNHYMHAL